MKRHLPLALGLLVFILTLTSFGIQAVPLRRYPDILLCGIEQQRD